MTFEFKSRSSHARRVRGVIMAAVVLSLFGAVPPTAATELPKATADMIEALKLDPALLSGIDDELKVPPAWIEAAKKERRIRVSGSRDLNEFQKSIKPFKERYPFITFDYTRVSYVDRVMSILLAYERGRIMTDVMTGFGGSVAKFKEENALESLKDVPNVAKVADSTMRDDDGFWVGHQVTYWCITYNTNRIKSADLPETWSDLLTKPAWRNGHLGLGNRPQLWVAPLWGKLGEAWTSAFIPKLFDVLKPQLRREGVNAMISLTAAGELFANLPGSGYRTRNVAQKGAPVGFHCPAPVPMSINLMAILRGSPNVHAAKLFVDWTLSKEGQIAQYYADRSAPVHAALQGDEHFIPYAQNIKGKPLALRSPSLIEDSMDKIFALWNANWERGAR